jgi:hypothetical protein
MEFKVRKQWTAQQSKGKPAARRRNQGLCGGFDEDKGLSWETDKGSPTMDSLEERRPGWR